MNLAHFIAKRYFFLKKKITFNFINILSAIAMLLVVVGAMSLVIVLSVFNGLEDLTRNLHAAYNPELKITPIQGKTFEVSESLLNEITEISHIEAVTRVIEDNALLRYADGQMAVKVKGVAPNFEKQYDLKPYLQEGKFRLEDKNIQYALLGWGVQLQLSVSLLDEITPLVFWYPKKKKRMTTNPKYNRQPIHAGGVLGIDQQFDQNHVLVPFAFAEKLMEYQGRVTSLEVKTSLGKYADNEQVKQDLHAILGKDFLIQNAEEQQAVILRAFKIERLFTFLVFVAILGLASLNIFFALAMLVVEKKHDIAILKAMGASNRFIRLIFLTEGALISFWGTAIGLALGFLIGWIQEQFGVISLGVNSTVVEAYPIALHAQDFVLVGMTVLLISLIASFIPAQNATKVDLGKYIK